MAQNGVAFSREVAKIKTGDISYIIFRVQCVSKVLWFIFISFATQVYLEAVMYKLIKILKHVFNETFNCVFLGNQDEFLIITSSYE